MNTILTQFARRFTKKRMNWVNAILLVIMIILHHFSIGWMAKSRSVELIMTGGLMSGIGTLCSVLGFILLRMTIVFLLPGFILSWLFLEFIDFFIKKREYEKILKKEII